MSDPTTRPRSVLVTGADGYVGRLLVRALGNGEIGALTVVAADLRLPPPGRRLPGVEHVELDVRSPAVEGVLRRHEVDAVVHLAAVVSPDRGASAETLYDIDVRGTRNVVERCLAAGVRHLVVTTSGAAYGYHEDNPIPLDEEDPLRGNASFPYAHHKRLVEELLATYREERPELGQLVLRPGTILGRTTENQITALFQKPVVVGVDGTDSPFVIIWDEDVVGVILKGLRERRVGVYNLAGDGVLTLREMAAMMGKAYVPLPPALAERGLAILGKLGLTRYGPEQVDFLRYRPVLSNRRLKEELGYLPRKTTREAFELYLSSRARAR